MPPESHVPPPLPIADPLRIAVSCAAAQLRSPTPDNGPPSSVWIPGGRKEEGTGVHSSHWHPLRGRGSQLKCRKLFLNITRRFLLCEFSCTGRGSQRGCGVSIPGDGQISAEQYHYQPTLTDLTLSTGLDWANSRGASHPQLLCDSTKLLDDNIFGV